MTTLRETYKEALQKGQDKHKRDAVLTALAATKFPPGITVDQLFAELTADPEMWATIMTLTFAELFAAINPFTATNGPDPIAENKESRATRTRMKKARKNDLMSVIQIILAENVPASFSKAELAVEIARREKTGPDQIMAELKAPLSALIAGKLIQKTGARADLKYLAF
jgi:hypothetical protein